MTKPQIWVAAVLVLFFLFFFLEKSTNRSDVQQKPAPNMAEQSTQSNKPKTADQLVVSLGCTGCHGANLSGTKLAPDLHNVGQYWSRDALINYLRNPSSYMSSDRFVAYRAKYQIIMPSFNNIDVKELGKVSDYLLQLKK